MGGCNVQTHQNVEIKYVNFLYIKYTSVKSKNIWNIKKKLKELERFHKISSLKN